MFSITSRDSRPGPGATTLTLTIAMSNLASKSQPVAESAQQFAPAGTQSESQDLYRNLSRLYREHLQPVGPIEQTLVESIVHNSFQIHRVQQAEREDCALDGSLSIMNLGRLARYREFLERSTREAMAQLLQIQQRRRLARPAVMAAAAAVSKPAPGPQPPQPSRSAVHREPTTLPVPRPIDQPAAPPGSAAQTLSGSSNRPSAPGPYPQDS